MSKNNIISIFFVFFVFSNLFFYNSLRNKYINDINCEAREYFVINDFILAYRVFLTTFLNPDSIIMKPLNSLQGFFYNKGINLLDENDGERALWKYKFNLYLYTRSGYMPYKKSYKSSYEIDEIQTALLDNTYQTIKDFENLTPKDENLKYEKYKIVPLLADYFSDWDSKYAGNAKYDKYQVYLISLRHEEIINKQKYILNLLLEYKKDIENDSNLEKFIKNNYKDTVDSLYLSAIDFLQNILYSEIIKNTFSCDNQYIEIYLKLRDESFDGNEAYFNYIQNKQENYIININICDNPVTKSILYELNKQCGIKSSRCYPNSEYINKKINKIIF